LIRTFSAALPHGISLSCRATATGLAPADAPRVLFLHGFPEAAFAWDEMIGLIGPRAFCLAPNLRGYERSSTPVEVAAYKPRLVMDDIEALIVQCCAGQVDLLVAHDWGGAIAWNLAAQRPQLMKRLFIINSPHPATFLRELRDNPAQQKNSAYMNFLCRPDAAALLAADGFARLWRFLENPQVPAWLTPAVRARYEAVWSMGLDGALNYYRVSPLRPPTGPADAIHGLQFTDAFVTARVPTTVLWGEADLALLPALLDGLDHWVPQLRLTRVPEGTHWLVHEQPRPVAQAILAALNRSTAGR
jgi:pimeloyl-ACP methyl ester carboxylesterase